MPGAYYKVEHLKGAIIGRLGPTGPTGPTNIRLGWKGLSRTNTLAYCENM